MMETFSTLYTALLKILLRLQSYKMEKEEIS